MMIMKVKRVSKKDYIDRSWNSLTDLKEQIEADKSEKIVSFNGWQLITNKWEYCLFDNKLIRRNLSSACDV